MRPKRDENKATHHLFVVAVSASREESGRQVVDLALVCLDIEVRVLGL